MTRQIISVSLLTSYIRQLVESDEILSDLWIEGEVAELFAARSGHLYFTLRDATSQVKCVAFRAQVQRFAFTPRIGDQVAVHGRISVYEKDGVYQCYVDSIQPAGMGIQALQLELLRQQLAAEGLFDPSRKRQLPSMPSCIGVVTSPDGAVWHDIQNVLRRRYPMCLLLLSPTAVQGESAPDGIVAALQALQDDGRAQVIILARGGGSAEDLSSFNDERVARAVFACTIPVVAGVGHETDRTLVDDIADLRAPTPSTAAELCSPSIIDLAAQVVDVRRTADEFITRAFENRSTSIANLTSVTARHDPTLTLPAIRTELSDNLSKIAQNHRNQMATRKLIVQNRQTLVQSDIKRMVAGHERRVELAHLKVRTLDPSQALRRGYALLEHADSARLIRSIHDVSVADAIIARVSDGKITGRVDSTEPSPSAGAAHVQQ